jgi:hypothetical protein
LIKWPELIEAVLNSIEIDEATRQVIIRLRTPVQRRRYALTGFDVSKLMVDEFRLQNIVDQISIYDADSPLELVKEQVWYLLYGAEVDRSIAGYDEAVSKVVHQIQAGTQKLLGIEPIYGAWLLVLAREFELVALA